MRQFTNIFNQIFKQVRKLLTKQSLGSSSTIISFQSKIIRTFRDSHPQVELVLKEICTNQQVEALNSGDIEVAFLHPPIEGDFELISIMTEKMVLALPEDHPLTTFTQVPISKLSDQSFILFPQQEGPYLYSRILSICQQAGFSPKVLQEVTPSQR